MALTAILIYVAFGTLAFGMQVAARAQTRSEVQGELSGVIDQLSAELRATTTQKDGVGGPTCYGVTVPRPVTGSADVMRHLNDILSGFSPHPPLTGTKEYVLNTPGTILEFYTYDIDPLEPTPAAPTLPLVKHRIRYGLNIPATGALARRYWPLPGWQPLQVTYVNDWYDTSKGYWSAGTPEPVTSQIVTDFVVIRPAGSQRVVQIVLEASVVNAAGTGTAPLRMMTLVTVRQ